MLPIDSGTQQTLPFWRGKLGAWERIMKPKQDQNSAGQTAHPAAPCPASGAHNGIT